MEENVLCTCLQSFICVLLPHRPPGGATIKKPGRFSFQTLSHSTLSASGKQEKERESTRRERERSEKESSALQRSRISSLLIYFPFHSLELILILCHNPGWLLFLRSALCVQKLCVVWIILNMCAFISRERV